MRRKIRPVLPREVEQDIEANYFAIELLMEENLFRRETDYLLRDPKRTDFYRGGIDLIDDPIVPQLARKFQVSDQLVILRLCMLGYFEPYVKGR